MTRMYLVCAVSACAITACGIEPGADETAGEPITETETSADLVAGPITSGTCSTRGCGGGVTNHARSGFYVKVANCFVAGDGPYDGDRLPCVTNPDNSAAGSGDFWMSPGQFSGNFPAYYDTDAFIAVSGCTTSVTKWIKGTGILLGNWNYDRHNKGTQWIKLNNAEFVEVIDIRC